MVLMLEGRLLRSTTLQCIKNCMRHRFTSRDLVKLMCVSCVNNATF